MGELGKWLMYLLLIFAVVAVLMNPQGFATVVRAGFKALNGLGTIITTGGSKVLWMP